MRILTTIISAGLISCIPHYVMAEDDSTAGEGKMAVEFQAPKEESYKSLAKALKESQFFSEMADGVNETYHLPRNLPVYFRQCDAVNAYYDPRKKEISICYELVARFKELFDANEGNSSDEVDENTLAATAFFFLHEMGHAFIDVMEIPATGKEEDAVDDLAALTLIKAEKDEPKDSSLYSVVDAFDDLSADYGDIDELPMWDEHSLTQQRLYTMLCMLYGSNPEAHSDLVGKDGLPKERAVRCATEYSKKREAWNTLLGDFMKDE